MVSWLLQTVAGRIDGTRDAGARTGPGFSDERHTGSRADDDARPGNGWPCQLVLDAALKPFAMQAWARSATFRKQCGILAAANAVVVVRSATARETMRAFARITMYRGGVYADVRVRPGANALELIAHEIEHVVERIEGVNLLLESRLNGTRVLLRAGRFETLRAVEAGRRVAQEVHDLPLSCPKTTPESAAFIAVQSRADLSHCANTPSPPIRAAPIGPWPPKQPSSSRANPLARRFFTSRCSWTTAPCCRRRRGMGESLLNG
jgi:hypothetical protein